VRDLFEAGIEADSGDISSALAGPCVSATVLRMEVSESIVCLQLHLVSDGSAPLVQQNLPAKPVLNVTTTFDLVFSSDRSSDRFTGKPVSQTTGLYYEYQRWYDPSMGRFIGEDPLERGAGCILANWEKEDDFLGKKCRLAQRTSRIPPGPPLSAISKGTSL